MNINTGYKFIAIVSLSYATFSCSSSVHSQADPAILARLDALQATVDVLATDLQQVYTAVNAAPFGQRACTVQEVIDQNFVDCDQALLPDGVSTATTFCIQQNRSGALGGVFKIEPEGRLELGAGWPNAIWGKLTGHVKFPVAVGPVPLPNELSASGQMGLGRGLNICVNIPVTALDAEQITQVHDLVRGINESGGKYSRRTGRVLNYAARRTPVATANLAAASGYSKPFFEDADDSFDIADAAIERMIDGQFTAGTSGVQLFSDPVFQDLISSLDVPLPAIETITDPERIFGILNTIGQSNIANTCAVMGITAESRARYPALANQCARFGIYPNISTALNSATRVANVQSSLSSLRSWMCSNISLGLFTGC